MAHKTAEEIDAAAAALASPDDAAQDAALAGAPLETTLAYGAEGDCVTKLVNLLRVLGHATSNAANGGPPKLDESVLVDVRAAQLDLTVSEPSLLEAAEIPIGVKGELVSGVTWGALYDAAGQKLEAGPAIRGGAGEAA